MLTPLTTVLFLRHLLSWCTSVNGVPENRKLENGWLNVFFLSNNFEYIKKIEKQINLSALTF